MKKKGYDDDLIRVAKKMRDNNKVRVYKIAKELNSLDIPYKKRLLNNNPI